MPYRMKGGDYVSYKTHNYCRVDNKWIDRKLNPGLYCPDCGRRVRMKARFKKNNDL